MEVTLSYIVVQCKCGYCGNIWEVEDDKAQNVDDAIDKATQEEYCRECRWHGIQRLMTPRSRRKRDDGA